MSVCITGQLQCGERTVSKTKSVPCSFHRHLRNHRLPFAMKIIITGGSNGLGAGVARMLAAGQHKIFLTGRRVADLESVAAAVEAAGSEASTCAGDVSKAEDVHRVFSAASEFFEGPPDVLIANAGCGAPKGPVETVTPEQFERVMSVNVNGVYLWLRAVLPTMKQAGHGQIIVTSSVAGTRVFPNGATYCASKWAIQVRARGSCSRGLLLAGRTRGGQVP